jgi:hypothetical protein
MKDVLADPFTRHSGSKLFSQLAYASTGGKLLPVSGPCSMTTTKRDVQLRSACPQLGYYLCKFIFSRAEPFRHERLTQLRGVCSTVVPRPTTVISTLRARTN